MCNRPFNQSYCVNLPQGACFQPQAAAAAVIRVVAGLCWLALDLSPQATAHHCCCLADQMHGSKQLPQPLSAAPLHPSRAQKGQNPLACHMLQPPLQSHSPSPWSTKPQALQRWVDLIDLLGCWKLLPCLLVALLLVRRACLTEMWRAVQAVAHAWLLALLHGLRSAGSVGHGRGRTATQLHAMSLPGTAPTRQQHRHPPLSIASETKQCDHQMKVMAWHCLLPSNAMNDCQHTQQFSWCVGKDATSTTDAKPA